VAPFVDLGFGLGLGGDVVGYQPLSLPPVTGTPDAEVDTSMGMYLGYGLAADAMVRLGDVQLGGGLFWLRAEAEDRLEVIAAPDNFILVPPFGLGYNRTRFDYDRSFDIDGIGARLIFGFAF
jgi:hypothetical protein